METIAARLGAVRERVARAAKDAGRDPASILLVAVSKKKPADAIREAHAAGQRDFGENYVQEMLAKADALADLADLRFHMIGHLQRNKARQVVRVAAFIHTVDSVGLARELGKRAAQHDKARLPVLVEVNVGGEEQKSGCAPDSVGEVFETIESEAALCLAGLMTVPPFSYDSGEARRAFDTLAKLREAHGGEGRLPELSMGMSGDLEPAVHSGATIVRVGTAIFGPRNA